MASYFAIIHQSKTGGFVGEFPDIPEGFTQGDTLEECIEMLQDVLNICAEEYTRERKEFQAPSSLELVRTKAQELLADSANELNEDVEPFIQLFKVPEMSMKPVKVTVSFAKSVLENIDSRADSLGMTRSGFLAKSALSYVEQ